MSMKSAKLGTSTSEAEVTHLSAHGFWLFMAGKEWFLDFDRFPWFRKATVAQICRIETHFNRIVRWPELDVDLDLDRIQHPEKYPLKSR